MNKQEIPVIVETIKGIDPLPETWMIQYDENGNVIFDSRDMRGARDSNPQPE